METGGAGHPQRAPAHAACVNPLQPRHIQPHFRHPAMPEQMPPHAATDATRLSSDQAFALFASTHTSPEDRQVALTALITAKLLPKRADDKAVDLGRMTLLRHALEDGTEPQHRLLAIAECIRLGQVVKRWSTQIAQDLKPAFERELPPMHHLKEADDRLNLARACAQMTAPWLPAYLSQAIAMEETGEKARGESMGALLARSSSLADAIGRMAGAFEQVRPNTEAPGDSLGRRLTRTLSALREAIMESELEAGDRLGEALYGLVAGPLIEVGRPQEEKVQMDLAREALLTVHDLVRTRISLVTDPEVYRVVEYCRRLCGGSSWPKELQKPLDRLITDVTEALLLLGRQGRCDQSLLGQLSVLTNHSERARFLARDLSARHPELPEDVRDWLEKGYQRTVQQASESAIEASASRADESIGLALQAARRARQLRDGLQQPLRASLEVFEPSLLPATQDLLDRVQVLTVQVEQAATLRGLGLYGVPGTEVDMSPKFFEVIGGVPRQRMTVRQPAVVRKRADGLVGDVVTKGLVE